MKIFGDGGGRGCFIAFNVSVKGSKGAMMSLPAGGTIPEAGGSGIIITDVSGRQAESISFLKCFEDAIYSYSFGSDIGDVSVSFLAFLAAGRVAGSDKTIGAADSGMFKKAIKYYADNRVSKSKKQVILSMGGAGGSMAGYLISMGMQTNNTELNIQSFTFNLKLVTVQEG